MLITKIYAFLLLAAITLGIVSQVQWAATRRQQHELAGQIAAMNSQIEAQRIRIDADSDRHSKELIALRQALVKVEETASMDQIDRKRWKTTMDDYTKSLQEWQDNYQEYLKRTRTKSALAQPISNTPSQPAP